MRRFLLLLGFLGTAWVGMGSAQAVCVLPYILQNGTIPDATQVMADFYALLNCIQSGGVTLSLSLAEPPEFIVTGSPYTGGVGTFLVTKQVQNAGTVWAGPVSGPPAVPTFQPLTNFITCATLPTGGCPFDVVMFWPGLPPNSQIVRVEVRRAVSCPANFADSGGRSRIAATAQAVVNINQVSGGVAVNRGTMTWAAGAVVPVVAGTGMLLADGDAVEFGFPGVADATMADVEITLKCSRV